MGGQHVDGWRHVPRTMNMAATRREGMVGGSERGECVGGCEREARWAGGRADGRYLGRADGRIALRRHPPDNFETLGDESGSRMGHGGSRARRRGRECVVWAYYSWGPETQGRLEGTGVGRRGTPGGLCAVGRVDGVWGSSCRVSASWGGRAVWSWRGVVVVVRRPAVTPATPAPLAARAGVSSTWWVRVAWSAEKGDLERERGWCGQEWATGSAVKVVRARTQKGI